jgi:hypothetical protein
MSIFSKPLSELGNADLQELVDQSAVENLRLEFKSEVPNKEETLKKLSSFANTFGGFMVVGARANSADGRIQDLCGVDEQSGYKQKLIQWSFDACSPPLVVEVSDPIPLPGGSGKVCYVVYTQESDVAPHFLNGRKGVWVRTDEFSARFEARLADEGELRHLLDRRKLVRERRDRLVERAGRRFELFADKSLGIDKLAATLFKFSVIPRFPARPLCEQGELRSLIQPVETNWVNWRQILFPDPSAPTISQHESVIILSPAKGMSFLEVNIWGLLFYGVRLDRDVLGGSGISLVDFVGHLLLYVRHSGQLLRRMGYSGPLHIESSLGPINGVKWYRSARNHAGFTQSACSELDNTITFSISPTREELADRPDGIALDILRVILFAVNASGVAESQQKLEELIREGFEANFWNNPPKL